MKRFVYVPVDMAENEESLRLASKISLDSRLAVRIGSVDDGIEKAEVGIISFPEKSALSCDSSVKMGFVCALDITNEFLLFNKNTYLIVTCPKGLDYEFKPVLLENHLMKFRFRLFSLGKHVYSVKHNDEIMYFGEIEVI